MDFRSSFLHKLATFSGRVRPDTGLILYTITWVPAIAFFLDHVAHINWIYGPSMHPTFNPTSNGKSRDLILLSKWSPHANLRQGQIIVYRSPINPERIGIKRIIGIQGDTVRTRPPYPHPICKVPMGHVWIEGDADEKKSLDSNHFGPISASLIEGRVAWRIWPPSRIGRAADEMPQRAAERVLPATSDVDEILNQR